MTGEYRNGPDYFQLVKTELQKQQPHRLETLFRQRILFSRNEIHDIHTALRGLKKDYSPMLAVGGSRVNRKLRPFPSDGPNGFMEYHERQMEKRMERFSQYLRSLGVSEVQYKAAEDNSRVMLQMYREGSLPKEFVPLVVPDIDIFVLADREISGLKTMQTGALSNVRLDLFLEWPGRADTQLKSPDTLIRFVL